VISVVTPTLNEAARLPPLLRALNAEHVALETIVVDGDSSDGTVEAARRGRQGIPLLRAERSCRLPSALGGQRPLRQRQQKHCLPPRPSGARARRRPRAPRWRVPRRLGPAIPTVAPTHAEQAAIRPRTRRTTSSAGWRPAWSSTRSAGYGASGRRTADEWFANTRPPTRRACALAARSARAYNLACGAASGGSAARYKRSLCAGRPAGGSG